MTDEPWKGEPDREEFVHAGLPCILRRGPMGVWCGYVGVPPEHPWHGRGCDEVEVSVHGGLNYSEACDHELGVCHVPAPGASDDVWWFGFDCAHGGDRIPKMERLALRSFTTGVYRTIHYARMETRALADQLSAFAERAAFP